RTVEEARDEARRLRLEAEDYCDQKLAAFEVVLDRTIKTVAAGREKLSATPPPIADAPDGRGSIDETSDGVDAFFDQDRP
ncbi:MAG: cell division initiation protein, partial [Acidimicrobiales bacterium]